ncbi:MAG TPA: cytochrome c biogenesis protein CcdA [Acidimicrobiales bacterium]|nr:cytochrome c biogenesis protein CcdA [Acidimicrobiales bacterium]
MASNALLPLFAIIAGIVSITSPCALPLIPSYLSYVSGLPVSELSERRARILVLRSTTVFIAGFTVVFTALGATSTLFGSLLIRHLPLILRIAGVIIVIFGLAMTGLVRFPFLARERRIDLSRMKKGPRGAFPLGMAFAFGWTPCLGPVLASILAVASASNTVAWGAVLLALYSLGLGIPFLLLAFGVSKARRSLVWLQRRGRAIEIGGGLLLMGVGVLFISGIWKGLFIPLQVRFARLGWPPI